MKCSTMFAGKPIIGIVGGIGSGKSFVASLFGELGCLVIDSDAQVRAAYRDPAVKAQLREWWGANAFNTDDEVDRSAVARIVFPTESERRKLEGLLHPWVDRRRREVMAAAAGDPSILAFVWDTPLLIEAGLHRECDALVFVEASNEDRLRRVRAGRGWDAAELVRREKLQMGLDSKREISDYVVVNTADAGYARNQVREILSRIVAGLS
jgi:dephospho-CoA kinase